MSIIAFKSNVQIVKTFENRIPIQTFEKYHNVSYCYVGYVNSETSWYFVEQVPGF